VWPWLNELRQRFLLQDHTALPEDPKSLRRAYLGIDPTADSLHIGHLAPIQLLYHLARWGVEPIIVIGGATARIGDPSGKSTERPLLPPEVVEANTHALLAQVQKLLPCPLIVRNNYEWLGTFSLIEFLREVGKHLTVSYLLSKESMQRRAETGLSFTEFSYPLLQAYDFWYLYTHEECRLQVGGSDQWGNITAGIELIQKKSGGQAHGLTCPLLTKADGTKFGKTESGNIWLDPKKTSPYEFYQFWFNQADADLPKLFGIYSWKSLPEIGSLLSEHAQAPDKRLAQKALALEMTARIHGPTTASVIQTISEVVFGSEALTTLAHISPDLLRTILQEMPHYEVPENALHEPLLQVLSRIGFLPSKSEGRRLIQQNGLSINKKPVRTPEAQLQDYASEGILRPYFLLQRGKKHLAWLIVRE
jgi:tyrosyl-tRNA synthetase